jgi:hypothetical protein
LKGAVGNFGAVQALELARKIEAAGRTSDLNEVHQTFSELERELSALFAELANFITERAA